MLFRERLDIPDHPGHFRFRTTFLVDVVSDNVMPSQAGFGLAKSHLLKSEEPVLFSAPNWDKFLRFAAHFSPQPKRMLQRR